MLQTEKAVNFFLICFKRLIHGNFGSSWSAPRSIIALSNVSRERESLPIFPALLICQKSGQIGFAGSRAEREAVFCGFRAEAQFS